MTDSRLALNLDELLVIIDSKDCFGCVNYPVNDYSSNLDWIPLRVINLENLTIEVANPQRYPLLLGKGHR